MYLNLGLWDIILHSTSHTIDVLFRAPRLAPVSLTLGPACHLGFRAGPQDLGSPSLPSFANYPPATSDFTLALKTLGPLSCPHLLTSHP